MLLHQDPCLYVSIHASVRTRRPVTAGRSFFTQGFNPRVREDATFTASARQRRGKSFNPRVREDATSTHATMINAAGGFQSTRP